MKCKRKRQAEATVFGAALRAARTACGFTLAQLGAEIGVSSAYLADAELGFRSPLTSARVDAVAAALGVDAAPLHRAAALDRGYVVVRTRGRDPSVLDTALALETGGKKGGDDDR